MSKVTTELTEKCYMDVTNWTMSHIKASDDSTVITQKKNLGEEQSYEFLKPAGQ